MSSKQKGTETLKRMAAILAVPKAEIDAAEKRRSKRSYPKRRRKP
jgi:hypothetical protein